MVRQVALQMKTRTIEVLGDEPITGQQLFSEFADRFQDRADIPFPISMSHENTFQLSCGWNFGSLRSKRLIKDSSWVVVDEDGRMIEQWMHLALVGDVRKDDYFWSYDGLLGYKAFRKPLGYKPHWQVRNGGFIDQVTEVRVGAKEIQILGLRGNNSAIANATTRDCGFEAGAKLPIIRIVFPIVFDRLGDENGL
jgi:hypothetical protein